MLRGAVYRGDAGSFVGILKRDVWPENALQLIGDGLLRVHHAPTEGIDVAAYRCVGALWDRGWEGDADLADGLEAAMGSGPVPLLRDRRDRWRPSMIANLTTAVGLMSKARWAARAGGCLSCGRDACSRRDLRHWPKLVCAAQARS